MSLGLSSTSDVITFDQNWHHLCSTSVGGEDLSSDANIRVIGQMEPEICTKMLKMWSEKLRTKFAATTPGCSMVKIGLQCVHVWLTKLSCFEGEGHKIKGSGFLLSFY